MTGVSNVRKSSDIFYSAEDIMQILDYSRSNSYRIIAKLNAELKKQGYEVRQGLISQRYFNKRFFIDVETPKEIRIR